MNNDPDNASTANAVQLGHALRLSDAHHTAIDRLLRATGLSFARWQVLDAVRAAQGKAGASGIARHLGHSRQSVQRIVNAMAGEGLIMCVADPQDKRSQQVRMGEQGRHKLVQGDRVIAGYAQGRGQSDSSPVSQVTAPADVILTQDSKAPKAPARRRVRAFEHVQQQILDQIRSGQLSTGSQLPPERELAKRMGYGRSAVREALRSLEMAGVLHFSSGAKGGAFVRESGSDGIFASIRAMLILNRLPLSDLLEVRASLLGQCASLGATRGTEADFQQLDDNIAAMERAVSSVFDQHAAIGPATDFYRFAARASHNPLMVLLVDAMAGLVAEMLEKLDHWPRLDAITPRREMVAAMRAGRGEEAERVIRLHSLETNRMLIAFEQQISVLAAP